MANLGQFEAVRKPVKPSKELADSMFPEGGDEPADVSKVKLFEQCSGRFVQELLQNVRVEVFRPGQVLCTEGEPGSCMYLIKRGEVEIRVKGNLVATLGDGCHFGEMCLLGGKSAVRTATCTAKTKCTMNKIDREQFTDLLSRSPKEMKLFKQEANRRKEGLKKGLLGSVGQAMQALKAKGRGDRERKGFKFENCVLLDNCFQGHLSRSRITGRVELGGGDRSLPDEFNIGLVDLAVRPVPDMLAIKQGAGLWDYLMSGSVALEKDGYLFKLNTLLYRSWLAQGKYLESCKTDLSTTYEQIVEEVLATPCNDANDAFGRSSPVQLWALLLLPVQLLGDLAMVLRVVLGFLILVVVADKTNSASWYRWERPLSLPLRLWTTADMIGFVASFGTLMTAKRYGTLLGGLAGFCICMCDHYIDVSAVIGYWSNTRFTIIQNLGGNVYLCERKAGMQVEGVTDRVHSKLKKLAPSIAKPALLCSIEGLVVELVPVEPSDWTTARRAQMPLNVLHKPVFNPNPESGPGVATWAPGFVPILESKAGPGGAQF